MVSSARTKTKHLGDVEYIATNLIDPSPLNHRNPERMKKEAMPQTVASVKKHGILQPLHLRPKEGGRYEIIFGERRWTAARYAGLLEVPAIIKKASDKDAHLQRIDENFIREDLDAWDQALTLRDLVDLLGSQKAAADHLGKTQDWVSILLGLLKCPQFEQEIRSGDFTATHARAIAAYTDLPHLVVEFRKDWKRDHEATSRNWNAKVAECIRDFSRPYQPALHDKHRKELDVRKVDGEERCFNLMLADRLKPAEPEAEPTPEPSPSSPAGLAPAMPHTLLRIFMAWLTPTIVARLKPAKMRPRLMSLLPAVMYGGRGSPRGIQLALDLVNGSKPGEKKWRFVDALEMSKAKGKQNDAAAAEWILTYIEHGQPWTPAEAWEVAQSLGIEYVRDWKTPDVAAEVYEADEMANRKYPPGLAPQDLKQLLSPAPL